jgi:hypothetical protein
LDDSTRGTCRDIPNNATGNTDGNVTVLVDADGAAFVMVDPSVSTTVVEVTEVVVDEDDDDDIMRGFCGGIAASTE